MGVPDNSHERMKTDADRSRAQSKVTAPEAAASEVTLGSRIGDSSCFMALEGEETIFVPVEMMRKRNVQLLRIVGDSLAGDHLLDGDVVIIEKRNTARDGEMVVACTINEGVSAKRFFRHGDRIRLEPGNPSCEALCFEENDVIIKGWWLEFFENSRADHLKLLRASGLLRN